MTSKNLTQERKRRDLISGYGIEFQLDIKPNSWPSNHAKHFQNILSLGSTRYSTWQNDATSESWKSQPWKIQIYNRAVEIIKRARECRDDEVNERTWRSIIETCVYDRFLNDVSCHQCNKRLWRSEIDPRIACDEEFINDLQYNKDACSCKQDVPKDQESGPIKLFAVQEEPRLMYTPNEKACLDRSHEEPDKIIALKAIGALKKYLHALKQNDGLPRRASEGCLKTSLCPNDKNPAVFPFIVGESKSGNKSSFGKIDLQVALAIKKSLDIQDGLCKKTGPKRTWVAGPLVWCITHLGSSWRVSAGYMPNRKHCKIEISTLWHGLITDIDDALQLVLIMDYICDWARYIHREIIIKELMILSRSYVDELSDMFSTTGITVASNQGRRSGFRSVSLTHNAMNTTSRSLERVAAWNKLQENFNPRSAVQSDILRQHDRSDIVVRDPKFITSRLVGVIMTNANFHELFDSISQLDQGMPASYLSSVLEELDHADPFYMNRSLLYEMESTWTGLQRTLQDDENPHDTFQLLFTVSYYIGLDWGLVREICYFAISEDAKELLKEKVHGKRRSSMRRRSRASKDDKPTFNCSPKVAQLLINSFQAGSVDDLLSHCLNRLSLRVVVGSLNTRNSAIDTRDFVFQIGSNQCCLTPMEPALSHRIIWALQTCNTPATTLHISTRIDDQSLFRGLNTGNEVNRNFANQVAILAQTESFYHTTDTVRSCGLCIYALDRQKLRGFTRDLLKLGFRFQHCMNTTRLDHESDEEFRWNTKSVDSGAVQIPASFRSFFQDLVTSLNQNEGEDTISYNPNEQTKNMRILTSILEYRNTCEDEEESDEETVKDKESDDDYVESVEDEYEEEDEDYEEEDEDYEEEGSISIPDSYLATWRHS